MIHLPKRYNYAEAYLTFKCPLNCGYCINGDVDRDRKELSGEDWVRGLNAIDFGETPITFGGGEPTLHKDFFNIINGVNPNTNVDLLTNLQFDLDKFMRNVTTLRFHDIFTKNKDKAYKSIRVSYHASQMSPQKLVQRVKILQDAGYPVGIFGLNHPTNLQDNIQMSELARVNQVYFFIKDYLGWFSDQLHGIYRYPTALSGDKKNVRCRTKELLISPEGNTHRCHRDLYRNENRLSNILDANFKIRSGFRMCDKYGDCNPCDVKLKTNRFLKMGNSSVEIIK